MKDKTMTQLKNGVTDDNEYYRFESCDQISTEEMISKNALKMAFIYSGVFDTMTIADMRKIFDIIDSVEPMNIDQI